MSLDNKELVIDRKTGRVRQAGADSEEGRFVLNFRARAEKSLYIFAKGVLGLDRLCKPLHLDTCNWLQGIPPYRKLLLLPRDHLKTSIVARALPLHILIQPTDSNIYRPGQEGRSTRILLANETVDLAKKQLRWIQNKLEGHELLRALWPQACWANARRDSKKWTEDAILIPRDHDFPEASIECVGVGSAVTGRHYNVHIFDDLVTFEASRSEATMHEAVDWFQKSRALMDDPDTSLEFTLGTKWGIFDLYSEIIENDTSVEHRIHSIVENGVCIFPRLPGKNYGFTLDMVRQLEKELGPSFYLLYMNSAENPALTSLRMEDIRRFAVVGNIVQFSEDPRDTLLSESEKLDLPAADYRGVVLNKDTYDVTLARVEYLRRGRST